MDEKQKLLSDFGSSVDHAQNRDYAPLIDHLQSASLKVIILLIMKELSSGEKLERLCETTQMVQVGQ